MLKRGLVADPKHRAAMGEAVWLYLYILDRADWDTGIAYDWRDSAEAEQMGMPVDTLRYQRRKLEQHGYITAEKSQHSQQIIIHNWNNPRSYSGKKLNEQPDASTVASLRESDNPLPLSEAPRDTQSDNQSSNPLPLSSDAMAAESCNQSCNQSGNPLPPPSINTSHVTDHVKQHAAARASESLESAVDEDYLRAVEAMPVYDGIDIRRLYAQALAWHGSEFVGRANPPPLTRRRFRRWLNQELQTRQDRLAKGNGDGTTGKPGRDRRADSQATNPETRRIAADFGNPTRIGERPK